MHYPNISGSGQLSLQTRYKVQAVLEILFVVLLQVSRHYLNLLEVPIKCKLHNWEQEQGGRQSQLDQASAPVGQTRHLACLRTSLNPMLPWVGDTAQNHTFGIFTMSVTKYVDPMWCHFDTVSQSVSQSISCKQTWSPGIPESKKIQIICEAL